MWWAALNAAILATADAMEMHRSAMNVLAGPSTVHQRWLAGIAGIVLLVGLAVSSGSPSPPPTPEAAGKKPSDGAGAASTPATTTETRVEVATLAGGCFWGMEEILRQIPGVTATRVGYTGGSTRQPAYEQVHAGDTGHAEAVEVTFDPAKISYEQLLGYFFRMHDPTTLNRQGNDVGTSYRSSIFFHSEAQRWTAEQVKARVDQSGKWSAPVVTEIVAAGPFWPAEEYHQKYLQKNPGGYTCHYLRD
jgi:peptide methionine sulfoxide reductase msrA/msrB